MVTAPYFSELVSSWAVGTGVRMLSFLPITEGMHRVWQGLSRNFGVPGCARIALSPLLLNAVAKSAPTAPGLGGWWGNPSFPQAGPVSKGGLWEETPTCCWILLLKYFWMSLRLLAEQRAR